MSYTISLTAKAKRDIHHVLRWFDEQQAAGAGDRWLDQLLTKVASLEANPEGCRPLLKPKRLESIFEN